VKEHRVRTNDVAGIVREIVSAVINHSLECPDGTKYSSLAIIELGYCDAHGEKYHVYWYGFQWMIVESAVGIWHIYIMMH
jgi:hypothetical protein